MSLDVLLAVPFDDNSCSIFNASLRRGASVHLMWPLFEARARLEAYLGQPVPSFPLYDEGARPPEVRHRSLTATTLATHLERSGLRWHVIDPGAWPLWRWRRSFRAADDPRVVAVCSTYMINPTFLHLFCGIVRRSFPRARLLVGGYYYSTNARDFFDLDADVFCVGEGEIRLPQIVQSIKEGRELDDIPGLYLRDANGAMRYTGPAEPLELDQLPAVDWSLSSRMEPAVDIDRDCIQASVETQRGCVFKCEFCTYRTLSVPNMLAPPLAVDRILNVGQCKQSSYFLVDPTGSFPPHRWKEVLTGLIHKGSSRPGICYVRVSDIDEEVAGLMKQAGIVSCFIGQETGDSRMLKRMRKGTRVEQVGPAMAALGANRLAAYLLMMHGFPGENDESLKATREMLSHVNDGFEKSPVAIYYALYPFMPQDFAAVTHGASFGRQDAEVFGHEEMPMERIGREILRTLVETSKVRHAPLCGWSIGLSGGRPDDMAVFQSPRRDAYFHWAKSVERAFAAFVEADLEGAEPDENELRSLREHILSPATAAPRWQRAFRASRRLALPVMRRFRNEWANEAERGIGPLTRVTASLYRILCTGRISSAFDGDGHAPVASVSDSDVDAWAASMAREAVRRGRKAKLKVAGGAGPA